MSIIWPGEGVHHSFDGENIPVNRERNQVRRTKFGRTTEMKMEVKYKYYLRVLLYQHSGVKIGMTSEGILVENIVELRRSCFSSLPGIVRALCALAVAVASPQVPGKTSSSMQRAPTQPHSKQQLGFTQLKATCLHSKHPPET